jgi:hypothetical protein
VKSSRTRGRVRLKVFASASIPSSEWLLPVDCGVETDSVVDDVVNKEADDKVDEDSDEVEVNEKAEDESESSSSCFSAQTPPLCF